MLKNKRILIISPHIDDEAICSGGLIMKAKNEGAKVFVLYMANGPVRQFMALMGEMPINKRIDEASRARSFGHFQYDIVYQGEEMMKLDSLPQQDLIQPIEDRIKIFKPDIVVIPNRNSFNQDHRVVGIAAMTACRPLPQDLRHQAKIILEMEEPYSWPAPSSPNFYIDISDVMNEKIELYRCHESQVPLDPFPRSVNNLIRLAGMRGCDISVKYAEAYNMLKGQLL